MAPIENRARMPSPLNRRLLLTDKHSRTIRLLRISRLAWFSSYPKVLKRCHQSQQFTNCWLPERLLVTGVSWQCVLCMRPLFAIFGLTYDAYCQESRRIGACLN